MPSAASRPDRRNSSISRMTKKELQMECKRRGISGYSDFDKAGLLDRLNNGTAAGDVRASSSGSAPAGTGNTREPTLAELREECRQRGLRNYSNLRKDELVRFMKDGKRCDSNEGEKAESPREPTLKELQAECRERGIEGFSRLNKQDLIRRMEDYKSGAVDKKGKRSSKGRGAGGRAGRGRADLRKGPLRSRAQERFDAGPTEADEPGFIYIYSEAGGADDEWKIGKTTLDPPERRMHNSARKNGKVYKLRVSWPVRWCGYAEKIAHFDLDDLQIVPGKEMADGGGREDGGTEWFRGDIRAIENRVMLVLRMVAVRDADEADAKGVKAFCGMFRCGLPSFTRRGRRATVVA